MLIFRRTPMLKRAIISCCIVFAISFCPAIAGAQWIIHAMGGTIKSVSGSAGTLSFNSDDGTPGEFQLPQSAKLNIFFDKEVRAETAAPDKAVASDSQVILFFFGDGIVRTAVAVQSVGSGPFQKVTGTVVRFDKHDRVLTIKTDTGQRTFMVSDKTVVDTPDGVIPGRKFSAERGDHLRLLAQPKDGQEQILLVRFDGNPT
jgi:hypothetical protein